MSQSYDYPDVETPVQTLNGPYGIQLVLDATQIYPRNPGLGTPMLFKAENGETMTWACGYEGGNLFEILEPDGRNAIWDWAEDIAEQVMEWEDFYWKLAERNAECLTSQKECGMSDKE